MNTSIYDCCVYTILHRDKLSGDSVEVHEGKRWVAAAKLWNDAIAAGEELAILFADATDCSCLVAWGVVRDIEVHDNGTTCSVERLKRMERADLTQELILLSTRRKIRANYIRPYALAKRLISLELKSALVIRGMRREKVSVSDALPVA